MSKLFTRASVTGASLSGASLKSVLIALWDALSAAGITDSNRTTVAASATLLTTQCGIVLVDCTAGPITLTLPTSGTSTDEAFFQIRRIDSVYANALTVQKGGTDTIEGGTSLTIGAGGQVDLDMPAGSTNWRITSRSGGTTLAARETLGVPAVNFLDNPDGEIYQRPVAATADDAYSEDRWYELTQTGTVTPSQQAAPEDGFAYAARITQSQATAQRFGRAQILEGKRTKKLRGKTMTFGGRFKLSTSANLRVAILAWTGTEDAVTSDVVNDWTSASYTAGGFFSSTTLTVVAVSAAAAMTAATARDVSVTGVIPSGATNIIVVYWTEATAAQNVTLDAWGRRLVEGATLVDYQRRTENEEIARCMRFYEAGGFKVGAVASTSNGTIVFKVPKRATPTMAYGNSPQGAGTSLPTGADWTSTTEVAVFVAATTLNFAWTASAEL